MIYCGVDLHANNMVIVAINDNGKVVREAKLPTSPTRVEQFFRSIERSAQAVVECTSFWYWLSDWCTANNIQLALAHSKMVKAISYAKVKTDRVDAKTLAELLRTGLIPEAHQASQERRQLPGSANLQAEIMLGQIRQLQTNIHRIEQEIERQVPFEEAAERLMAVPRLGKVGSRRSWLRLAISGGFLQPSSLPAIAGWYRAPPTVGAAIAISQATKMAISTCEQLLATRPSPGIPTTRWSRDSIRKLTAEVVAM